MRTAAGALAGWRGGFRRSQGLLLRSTLDVGTTAARHARCVGRFVRTIHRCGPNGFGGRGCARRFRPRRSGPTARGSTPARRARSSECPPRTGAASGEGSTQGGRRPIMHGDRPKPLTVSGVTSEQPDDRAREQEGRRARRAPWTANSCAGGSLTGATGAPSRLSGPGAPPTRTDHLPSSRAGSRCQ